MGFRFTATYPYSSLRAILYDDVGDVTVEPKYLQRRTTNNHTREAICSSPVSTCFLHNYVEIPHSFKAFDKITSSCQEVPAASS